MPGSATAQLLNYATVVDVDLDQTNDVNLADVEDYGHRVQVEIAKEAINNYFGWERAVGAARPSAKLNTASEAAFVSAVEAALSAGYVDIDGVTGGLHFSSSVLSTNPDARIRKDGLITANDIPLAFVLYKLYGSSTTETLDKIYNLEDAYEMLGNESVSAAINTSLKAQVAGSLDVMFRDLLSADPHRFFDASGVPLPGIFETNSDVAGSGLWKMTDDDIIEIKVKMIFKSKITRRGVAGREHLLSDSNSGENQQVVIAPEDYFYIRFQFKCV
jgi:hypothetical protein